MKEAILSRLIQQTEIQVSLGSIVEADAEALVSSDDIYLTQSGGVSSDLLKAGGDSIREDIRKHKLPLKRGAVVVTSAGRLPASYLLHAITNDFKKTRTQADALIPYLIKRILAIAEALEIKHVTLPLLGTGLVGLDKSRVIELILDSLGWYLSSHDYELGRVTIAVLPSGADQIRETVQNFGRKLDQTAAIQDRIETMRALGKQMPGDEELNGILEKRIEAAEAELRQQFYFSGLGGKLGVENGDSGKGGREEARKRLQMAIERNETDIKTKIDAQHRKRRLLEKLESQKTDPLYASMVAVLELESEDLQKDIRQLEREIDSLRNDQQMLRQQMDAL